MELGLVMVIIVTTRTAPGTRSRRRTDSICVLVKVILLIIENKTPNFTKIVKAVFHSGDRGDSPVWEANCPPLEDSGSSLLPSCELTVS